MDFGRFMPIILSSLVLGSEAGHIPTFWLLLEGAGLFSSVTRDFSERQDAVPCPRLRLKPATKSSRDLVALTAALLSSLRGASWDCVTTCNWAYIATHT